MINCVNVKPNIETTTSGNVAAVPFKENGKKDKGKFLYLGRLSHPV